MGDRIRIVVRFFYTVWTFNLRCFFIAWTRMDWSMHSRHTLQPLAFISGFCWHICARFPRFVSDCKSPIPTDTEVSTNRLRPKSATKGPDKENEQKSQDWGRWSQIAYKTDAKTVKDAPLLFSSMFRKSWQRLRVFRWFPEFTRHVDGWRELTGFWNAHVTLLGRSSLHVHWFWLQSSTTACETCSTCMFTNFYQPIWLVTLKVEGLMAMPSVKGVSSLHLAKNIRDNKETRTFHHFLRCRLPWSACPELFVDFPAWATLSVRITALTTMPVQNDCKLRLGIHHPAQWPCPQMSLMDRYEVCFKQSIQDPMKNQRILNKARQSFE